ncbi:MAG: hypothetical protein FWF34_01085 [Alphaproteobacteria bacterium]|nr:hypothetical protein [Alphaproteobacteria bacterium]
MPATHVSASGFGDVAVFPVAASNAGHVFAYVAGILKKMDKIKINGMNFCTTNPHIICLTMTLIT